MVHDAEGGSKDNETELSWGEEIVNEFLEVLYFKIVPGWDDSAFIESSVKFDNDLATSSVINNFKLIDVTYTQG